MKNLDIRLAATRYNVKLWQIAEAIGVTDGTLSRKLRKELSEDWSKKKKKKTYHQCVASIRFD